MQQSVLDSEVKKPEPREYEHPPLVGDVYPLVTDFDHHTVNDVLKGMQRCYDKNPDLGFSVVKLIARLEDLLIFSNNTEDLALICEQKRDDFGKFYLFLWGAYANKGVRYDPKKAYNTLKWAAEKLDCSYIETVSQRAGWLRSLKKFADVEVVPTITYRIEL